MKKGHVNAKLTGLLEVPFYALPPSQCPVPLTSTLASSNSGGGSASEPKGSLQCITNEVLDAQAWGPMGMSALLGRCSSGPCLAP